MLNHRAHQLNEREFKGGNICYNMSRDQRISDNQALYYSIEFARKHNTKIFILFALRKEYLNARSNIFDFMLAGLKELIESAEKKNIKLIIMNGDGIEEYKEAIKLLNIGKIVVDFDPLKIKRLRAEKLGAELEIPVLEIDAHNICPVREISQKQEYAAYTLRPKILKRLNEFLYESDYSLDMENENVNIGELPENLNFDLDKYELSNSYFSFATGEKAAIKTLDSFIDTKLANYSELKNDPSKDAVSDLSPYLHFGMISSKRIALEVLKQSSSPSTESFLEELVVRKELADNYCLYNKDHDNFNGFPEWAKKTLNEHRKDKREFVYGINQFECAETHDPLWNAAQNQMVQSGKMHGFMRMYWAKKILEWTACPEQAQEFAIYLNDKYSLDGRDPNGYAGIAWSIGGVHDRAWFERPIFGKIRYMNYNGCKRKFDADDYIQRWR
jgi:deoxyribodipyrimidine photo-lyase